MERLLYLGLSVSNAVRPTNSPPQNSFLMRKPLIIISTYPVKITYMQSPLSPCLQTII